MRKSMQSKITKFDSNSTQKSKEMLAVTIDTNVLQQVTRFFSGYFDNVVIDFTQNGIEWKTIQKGNKKNNKEKKIRIDAGEIDVYDVATETRIVVDPYTDVLRNIPDTSETTVTLRETNVLTSDKRVEDHNVYTAKNVENNTQLGDIVKLNVGDESVEVLANPAVKTIQTEELSYQSSTKITDSYKLKQWLSRRKDTDNYLLICISNNWNNEYCYSLTIVEIQEDTHNAIDSITFTENNTDNTSGDINTTTVTELGDNQNDVVDRTIPEQLTLTDKTQWGFYRVKTVQGITKHLLKNDITNNNIVMSLSTEFPLKIEKNIENISTQATAKIAPVISPE